MSMRKNVCAVAVLAALCLVIGIAGDAHAYGPEGMFGGRVNPDGTIVLDNPLNIEDRPERAQSVLQHPRPDFDPVPLSFGSFELFPSLEFNGSYDSNIYADRDGRETDDAIMGVRPAVTAVSNWNRNALSMTTYGDMNRFAEHSVENFNNFVTDFHGRYDVEAKTWIGANAGYQHLSESRSSPNALVSGGEPVTFGVYKTGLSAYRGRGLLKAGVDYGFKRLSYNDVSTPTGTIDQNFRDRNEHSVDGKVSYNLTENLKPYVKAGYNWRIYDDNTAHRSQGYDAVVGAVVDFGGITSAEAFVGWMSQDFDKFAFKKENGALKFGGRVEWNVTGMTSIILEANRTIEESTSNDFNSFVVSGGSATLTHELLRNVLLEGDLSYERNDFNGSRVRQDDQVSAGTGVRWLINRNLYSDFVYNWSERSSTQSDADYNKHVVSVRVGVQM